MVAEPVTRRRLLARPMTIVVSVIAGFAIVGGLILAGVIRIPPVGLAPSYAVTGIHVTFQVSKNETARINTTAAMEALRARGYDAELKNDSASTLIFAIQHLAQGAWRTVTIPASEQSLWYHLDAYPRPTFCDCDAAALAAEKTRALDEALWIGTQIAGFSLDPDKAQWVIETTPD